MAQSQPGKPEVASVEPVILRADQRTRQPIPGNPMIYEPLTPEGTESMAMFSVTAAPGQSTGTKALQHKGDEMMTVLSGKLEVTIEDLTEILGQGDSVFIPRGLQHWVTCVGTGPATALFVLSPPEY